MQVLEISAFDFRPMTMFTFRLRLFSEHALKIRADWRLIFRACSENKGRLVAYFQSML